MTLARDVGGWDVEWIAEDYHMGIKFLWPDVLPLFACFLRMFLSFSMMSL